MGVGGWVEWGMGGWVGGVEVWVGLPPLTPTLIITSYYVYYTKGDNFIRFGSFYTSA